MADNRYQGSEPLSLSTSSSTSAQDLLNALIELRKFIERRQLNFTEVFGSSKRFSSFMSDLHPELKKEIRVISSLIDAGWIKRMQDAPAHGRAVIAGQIKVWLDEELQLKSETIQVCSSALLAFYNGETTVAEAGLSSSSPQAPAPPSPSPGPGVSSAAEDSFAKGAMLYVKGKHREAADWYRQAALQGNADAQYMLGNMYRDGDGVEKDWRQAEELYLKAAAKGHAEARQTLRQLMVADSASPSAASSQPAPLKPYNSPFRSAVPSLRDVYANKRVGEYFEFGRYPQGPNGEIKPITWRVLRRDSNGLLVIAQHGLDAKPYNEERVDITWADCTLRHWLNGEFFNKAFNEQEQSLIKTSNLSNNAGPSTDDRIFLLSIDEATSLFANGDDRITKPVAYAIKNGAGIWGKNDRWKGNAWWWLRSRDNFSFSAAFVLHDGDVGFYSYVHISYGSVRPAFLAI
ncbi:MAG: sel1 repeat family protein [bacterium]|nr:sel1 repeat family protein [bacterium]